MKLHNAAFRFRYHQISSLFLASPSMLPCSLEKKYTQMAIVTIRPHRWKTWKLSISHEHKTRGQRQRCARTSCFGNTAGWSYWMFMKCGRGGEASKRKKGKRKGGWREAREAGRGWIVEAGVRAFPSVRLRQREVGRVVVIEGDRTG